MYQTKKITQDEASKIIDTRKPLGLFWLPEDGRFVGIDNTDGNAWTEDFSSIAKCIRWLKKG